MDLFLHEHSQPLIQHVNIFLNLNVLWMQTNIHTERIREQVWIETEIIILKSRFVFTLVIFVYY